MSTSTSRAEFSAPLALQPPEGPPLNVIGREVAAARPEGPRPPTAPARESPAASAEGRLQDCRLPFEVTAEQYRAAATRGLFHLAPDNRGPGADTFAPTGTVRIERKSTRLNSSHG